MIDIWVPGQPRPQGSKRIYNGNVVDSNQAVLRPWRSAIAAEALQITKGRTAFTGPVEVHINFVFHRPKSHYRTGQYAHLLKPTAPEWVTSTPDLDKLIRAVCDSLTDASVFSDDAQVAVLIATKAYGEMQGARILVKEIA